MNLSVIIIAKNGEDQIERAIQSVDFADEIIVVDGGSTDSTVAVAKKLKAKVIRGVGNDFGKQREIGKNKAKNEWIFYIDTDEQVTSQLAESIKNAISSGNDAVAYVVLRKNFYLGNHEWPYVEKLERLFQKKYLKGWRGSLHETAIIDGKIGNLNGYLFHYTHKNLSSMLEKTLLWSSIEAKLRLDADHPKMVWWRFIRVMITAFYNSYIKQKGYKAGTAGLIESIYQAYSMFITYARLWEMQENGIAHRA